MSTAITRCVSLAALVALVTLVALSAPGALAQESDDLGPVVEAFERALAHGTHGQPAVLAALDSALDAAVERELMAPEARELVRATAAAAGNFLLHQDSNEAQMAQQLRVQVRAMNAAAPAQAPAQQADVEVETAEVQTEELQTAQQAEIPHLDQEDDQVDEAPVQMAQRQVAQQRMAPQQMGQQQMELPVQQLEQQIEQQVARLHGAGQAGPRREVTPSCPAEALEALRSVLPGLEAYLEAGVRDELAQEHVIPRLRGVLEIARRAPGSAENAALLARARQALQDGAWALDAPVVDDATLAVSRDLVAALGADEYAGREAAMVAIREMGADATAALVEGLASDDLEVRTRARRLLVSLDGR